MRTVRIYFYAFALAVSTCGPVLADAETPEPVCDKTFSDVFANVSPSVVRVFAMAIDPFSLKNRVQHGVGTGFVIDEDGHIVTNAHIVYGANEVMISVDDKSMFPAEIIGVDPIVDLAVIKLQMPVAELPRVAMGESDSVKIGQEVLAIGFPFGIGKTATRGIVSGLEIVIPFSTSSWMTPMIQTDAAINPGNSGGPLVNRCGEVVAVNTLGSPEGQNVNFSVPIDIVRESLPELIEHGHVIRPWHGINGAIVPMPFVYALGIPPGYMIETIEPGSPAEELGLIGGSFPVWVGGTEFLLGGDVISHVNGEPMTDMEAVFRIARSMKVGDTIEVNLFRNGFPLTIEVVLPERPVLAGDLQRFREHRQSMQ